MKQQQTIKERTRPAMLELQILFSSMREIESYIDGSIWETTSSIDDIVDQQIIHLKLYDTVVAKLKYQIKTDKEDRRIYMISVSEQQKLSTLRCHAYLIKLLTRYKDVSQIDATRDNLAFVYKDRYFVEYSSIDLSTLHVTDRITNHFIELRVNDYRRIIKGTKYAVERLRWEEF